MRLHQHHGHCRFVCARVQRDYTYVCVRENCESNGEMGMMGEERERDLHHSTNPETAVDGVDADDGASWVVLHLIEQPYVVCHH